MFCVTLNPSPSLQRFFVLAWLFVVPTGFFTGGFNGVLAGDDDAETQLDGECTGYLVTGMAGNGDCFLHKNRDSSTWREGVAIVTPEQVDEVMDLAGKLVTKIETESQARLLPEIDSKAVDSKVSSKNLKDDSE